MAEVSEARTSARNALREVAAVLTREQIPFALAGSYALWVHGAAEPDHDVDFCVAEDAVEPAARALADAGFRIDRPPENWLFKAWSQDGVLVDLLHRLAGEVVDAELLDRALDLEVIAVRMPVLSATDVISSQLRAMNEHYCDFGAVLPAVRAVREQVDWERLRAETKQNPFAVAFLYLTELLGVGPGAD